MPDPLETIALVGNPNAGKTTLFNALTGAAQRTGNYAGVTVERKSGEFFTPHGRKLQLVDLPGCYALDGSSPDQEITRKTLLGEFPGEARPDLVVCVLDASNLERHLVLALEVIELGLPVVIALNMIDFAEQVGLRLDPAKLAEELGVPVVALQANVGKGVLELKQALRHPFPARPEAPWKSGPEEEIAARRRSRVFQICEVAARRPDHHSSTRSDKLDSWLLHPLWGALAFIGLMLLVFWSIFSFASVPMGWIESLQSLLAERVTTLMPDGDLRGLIVDGIIGGVGSVVVFLPQILLLFFFIGLLESSGYMARAAFLMDGLMGRAGLSGKAFLPLFSSYACAIPGIMATRTIDSAKERLVTIFVAPWMSCSARLPVYLVLVPMLLSGKASTFEQAAIFLAIYALGTLAALGVARLLRGKLGPDEVKHHFMLELPPYRTPQWSYIFRHVGGRGWSFLQKAGTLILAINILLWAAQTYPKSSSDDPAEQLAHSTMGRVGKIVEPIAAPLGLDARTGTAILTSFAAREVFVSSMTQLFRVEQGENDEETWTALRKKLATETWPDGRPMFTLPAILALLVFFIYALQCLPTSAVVAREAGSWKWAAAQFVFMSAFAWLAAFAVFQIGSILL